MRVDGRAADELRPVTFERDFTEMTLGSTLVTFGRTRVLCTASVQDDVPRWMKGRGTGWVTAEYSMLPGSSPERVDRKVSGRTQEIQRLIGRSLRSVCDMALLGERLVTVDCDVLQADGGTRTAAITGGYVALHDAVSWLAKQGSLRGAPDQVLHRSVSAVSVGVIGGEPRLELCYEEDVVADVDMNVVCTGTGEYVEVQGTGEQSVFTRAELDTLLDLGAAGCAELTRIQQAALGA
jgi:ribonuclease PH